MLCLYLAIGIVAVILFSVYGSKVSRSGKEVEYTFTDDGRAGERIEGNTISVIGEAGANDTAEAAEEEPEEIVEEKTVVEEETEPVTEEKHFYKFNVTTQIHKLRIRKEPSLDGKIISHLNKGEVGYVLEKGEEWSYITNGKATGYCANEYMDMTEISIDELPDYYPEEYKVLSTEEITY